jgi:hypothetical protein
VVFNGAGNKIAAGSRWAQLHTVLEEWQF